MEQRRWLGWLRLLLRWLERWRWLEQQRLEQRPLEQRRLEQRRLGWRWLGWRRLGWRWGWLVICWLP